jgi:lipopolysaccharide biosynthesis protein
MKESTKLIAFYLPQFHPIPENDLWWGKEFTEWTNVRKAKPNFEGHYQPRYPGELGYYDLRDIEVQKKQIALAKEFGVYGFCYYYYWFSGKRLLERPLDQFLENKDLDFPFCICWANENWTRRWDGLENEILIAQNHTPEDYHNFIRDVAPLLADSRYIRIGGKPLLIVYRVSLLPNPSQAAEIWRKECLRQGIGEVYLAAVQSFGIQDPRPYGFDAAIEFPPFEIPPIFVNKNSLNLINQDFCGIIQDYRVTAALKMQEAVPVYTKFRTIIPGWDSTARRQNNSGIFANSSPAIYKKWLKEAVEYTKKHLPYDHQFIFINAWNEWAEGAYLEPDKRYGRDYLQATKEALELNPKNEKIFQTPEEKIEDLNYLIKTLNEDSAGLREHTMTRDAQLLERDAQLANIHASKAWKLTLWLRRLRLWVAPPQSIQAEVIRIILKTIKKIAKIR